jgi:thymidylate synthase (FAD)
MRVTRIAETRLSTEYPTTWFDSDQPTLNTEEWLRWESYVEDADFLAEFSGRACYEAWERKNPATATNQGYLENIIRQGHFSVLEHASASYYVTGVSRTLTHELVRHRHLSYSQMSQRYVNQIDVDIVIPPEIEAALREPSAINPATAEKIWELQDESRGLYEELVRDLMAAGRDRKAARGAARFVLMAGTETRLVVTGNHRAWRDAIMKRWHMAADIEIRTLFGMILRDLKQLAPNTYQDIPDEPYGS